MNKKVLIGLGVLAVAGIGYYMWKKNKDEESS
jgi:LPXTG-motif cell wall-anchored protein